MKKQRAFHQNATDSVEKLNNLLFDGWVVVSTTVYRPAFPSGYGTLGVILVILEKEC